MFFFDDPRSPDLLGAWQIARLHHFAHRIRMNPGKSSGLVNVVRVHCFAFSISRIVRRMECLGRQNASTNTHCMTNHVATASQ